MKKFQKRLSAMMLTLLIAASMTGCAHYKVISADKEILRIKAAQAFSPKSDGWFVPDARWLEINDALASKLTDPSANAGAPR